MKQIRMLITGVGRRVELVQAFRQAALSLNYELKIFGADSDDTAPALAFCDFEHKICKMDSPKYIEELLDICKKNNIDVLLPTIDTDLLVLAKNASLFSAIKTKVIISTLEKVQICSDKNLTASYFNACGLHAPKTYNDFTSYNGPYPCFIKPKNGSSSIDAYKVNNAEELKQYASKISDYVVQTFVSGTEYTVDIFCDYDGNPIFITPRKRITVRSGEVLKTEIALDEEIIEECKILVADFKPCGPITIQLIKDEISGENFYIEINPRFGGGAPLSIKAGADSAKALLQLAAGEKPDYGDRITDSAVYSRFDQSVCVHSGTNENHLQGIIFDLDDTLYSEKSYVLSGFCAVASYLNDNSLVNELWTAFETGKPAFDTVFAQRNITDKINDCLYIYRNHTPSISLYNGALQLIRDIKDSGTKVGVITDGRPEEQRLKILALGLQNEIDDIIITDELGGSQFRKPNDISFRIIQRRWRVPFESIVYIGDNPSKDCQAPRQLGMKFYFFNNPDGLYSHTSKMEGLASLDDIGNKCREMLRLNV